MILDKVLSSYSYHSNLPFDRDTTITTVLVLPENLSFSLCAFAIGLFSLGCYWLFQTMRAIPENHDYTGESGGYNINAERRKRAQKARKWLFNRSERSDNEKASFKDESAGDTLPHLKPSRT
ncbi:hypothetical protein CROQUDRAFT_656248 [Cronartium quercuum f. sp. fusiforme G11]|uniref:Uncharacterized protein n=1 Tax=Cronartium quercuum f. sp. fusiforme G11 TaxID=708437 RepID=A0A9P6TCF9_9BASI|nr:hypothetical protein CROQUDRAFT_656248 [Cronartium quercuum f. sp. fusiforme G11]